MNALVKRVGYVARLRNFVSIISSVKMPKNLVNDGELSGFGKTRKAIIRSRNWCFSDEPLGSDFKFGYWNDYPLFLHLPYEFSEGWIRRTGFLNGYPHLVPCLEYLVDKGPVLPFLPKISNNKLSSCNWSCSGYSDHRFARIITR